MFSKMFRSKAVIISLFIFISTFNLYTSAAKPPESPLTGPIQNAGFETGKISPWKGSVVIDKSDNKRSGTYSGKVTKSNPGCTQMITGLKPNTRYTFSGHAMVAVKGESVRLGVRDYGGKDVFSEIKSTVFTAAAVTFKTGPKNTSAVIYIYKASGTGAAYCDDFNLSAATITVDELKAMEKWNAHVHTVFKSENDSNFVRKLNAQKWKWLNVPTGIEQIATAMRLYNLIHEQNAQKASKWSNQSDKNKERYAWTTTFDRSQAAWDSPDFTKNALKYVVDGFNNGAVGVKIWKDIGLTVKNHDGTFAMPNDPRLDPVYDLIESSDKTLCIHAGDPIKIMDQYPGANLDDVIKATEDVLYKHPKMRAVWAHLASVGEEDVDRLAALFDRHPNMATDISARLMDLIQQDQKKVRDFFIKYQDRILWGTDTSENEPNPIDDEQQFIYFINTLNLPREVILKIFNDNVVKWYPDCK